MKKRKLAIIALGKSNSGKSSTWHELFQKRINTGKKKLKLIDNELELFVKNASFEETHKEINIDVFVKNASFEERGEEINSNSFKTNELPDIVLCSVQYIEKGIKTINWFRKHDYYLYIQWINPDFCHKTEYSDYLGFEKEFSNDGIFTKVTGKEKTNRTKDIRAFLINWATKHKNK